ncbi:uncharacterized protein HMPREF1541_07915 [Cyphellophora europaea CBS 101466]|uniref:Major facilitator superfamily (MFS) profile domain-containing protein n=1 Tax=Cyphellophora europaea (strain CBS 101466) TaxID=1220924 RepID=W2RML2_CYPE1|nr:uncharacterized protein HMPREF1541_07915 [Cyphellophora europaea CBS 101466]ETN36928.1 hypothetical protein HMPREF1541_07915 [Cyphellophora europaea CBS 101466]
MFSATKLQVATYLLGVCPFSIAFLVFLNSSVSFVITDLIGQDKGVGNAVGNLGFADELLALVACPLWGLLSDRIGVRYVCVIGYAIIALALALFVQALNVYPQLLFGRLLFSLGGAAASTMVTAVLPAVSSHEKAHVGRGTNNDRNHATSPSITSDLTITPARFRTNTSSTTKTRTTSRSAYASTSRVAGFVGMFTGCGALIALLLFLPLPARFQHAGIDPARALKHAFYIVAIVALILAVWCFIGLRNLAYEQSASTTKKAPSTYPEQLRQLATNLKVALRAGFRRKDIALGYLGGFVARASSVGISLFIPLLVNALFLDSDLCQSESTLAETPGGLPDLKRKCPRAYVVAASMTGVCETVALIAAPAFGYLSTRTRRRGLPLMVAAATGVVGYPLFAMQFDPDDTKKGARVAAFIGVCLIGISQIGAIVCSLGVLSAGVLREASEARHASAADGHNAGTHGPSDPSEGTYGERDALLGHVDPEATESAHIRKPSAELSLAQLKGSVAGIYSFYGGAAILVLTKVGGLLFDKVDVGSPFYIMAAFNGVLLVACVGIGMAKEEE